MDKTNICPLSGAPMENPVIADDGHSYDKSNIEEWFRTCQVSRKPVTSPLTRAVMTTKLRYNVDLQRAISSLKREPTFTSGLSGLSSIHELNAVFAQLDLIRDILAESLKEWQPPQLVVIGSESSGKSSLLERLAMMPILPTAEGICTRLPIYIRLRNTHQAEGITFAQNKLPKKYPKKYRRVGANVT